MSEQQDVIARQPLYSIEVEQALIGCVLIEPNCLDELIQEFRAEYFYLHKHRWVWEAFMHLHDQRTPVDFLTVTAYLEDHQKLEELGGAGYLTRCLNAVPTFLHYEAYAKLIQRDWLRRKVLEHATNMAKLAYAEENDLPREVAKQLADIEALITSRNGQMIPMAEAMRQLFDHVQAVEREPQKYKAISTGFHDLDNMLGGGIYRRQLTLVTGDPGIGKSKLILQWAKAFGADGNPGGIWEMEMSMRQTSARMVSAKTGIKTNAIQYGPIKDNDFAALVDGMDSLSGLPIFINSGTQWTTLDFQAEIRKLVREEGLQWAIVDYFDLFADDAPHGDANLRDVTMVRRLTNIATNLDIALVVVHTLTKMGMLESQKKMGHVSGNSKITYAANNILNVGVHQPDPGYQSDPNKVTISAIKMRDTEITGACDLIKKPGYPCFASVYDGPDEAPPDIQRAVELFN